MAGATMTSRSDAAARVEALQAAYDAAQLDEQLARANEPIDDWTDDRDEQIDRDARALSRAGVIGGGGA
jgi:hypothetical protein